MQNFLIKVVLKIVTMPDDERNKFLVLLDEDGNFPSLYLSHDQNIDDEILKCLRDFLYENEIFVVSSTKKITDLNIKNNELHIFYQFISLSTFSKKGAYTVFDKRSIELYKLSKDTSI